MSEHWKQVGNGSVIVHTSPESLWKNAETYFKWCEDNPIKVKSTIKSGKGAGQKVEEEHPRPYSIKALCLHCGVLEEYIRDIRASQDKSNMYYIVISKILYLIYIQNLELATVGVFNPIFVSKVLNMERDDTPSSAVRIEIVGGIPELSESENAVLEKLELENRGIGNADAENLQR